MHWIDGTIVLMVVTALIALATYSKRYTRGVTDFLSANRCGRRYLLTVADATAGVGVVAVLAVFESFYRVGFCWNWWISVVSLVHIGIAVSGWVLYRFRETRAMTMAQFFEMRYSRRFRLFAGILGFSAGIINYGIFPVVTSRLIVNFMGLPASVSFAGISVSTAALVMAALLSIAVYLTVSGGQIAVMITDFVQGSFVNMVFLFFAFFMIAKFGWGDVIDGLKMAPPDQSLINPFKMAGEQDFGPVFYFAMAFMTMYTFMAWQGGQGYFSAAKTPHEAKMAKIWASWRLLLLWVMVLIFTVVAYAIFHNPKFAGLAGEIQHSISQIPDEQTQQQLRVPMMLRHVLPTGMVGLFCAVMVTLAISTDDTNLHSWSSIFVQDVLMPLRKQPLSPRQHMLALRLAVFGVAVFVFIFGLIFPLKDYLVMFQHITGAIFVGGGGIVIIGGLYWKRGTTAGAWSAMITGASIALTGILLQNVLWPMLPELKEAHASCGWLQALPEKFPVNGMMMGVSAALVSISVYVLVSLCSRKPLFNLERMLHRGQYALEGEHVLQSDEPLKGWKKVFNFGGKEFSRLDRIVCRFTVCWTLFWTLNFVVGTPLALIFGFSDDQWAKYWLFKTSVSLFLGIITAIWLLTGGIRDLTLMLRDLRTAKRDDRDDGTVVDGHNLADEAPEKSE